MPSRLESLIELFAELRRRRVVRSALVYIGGAFVTLEMTGVAIDTYALPAAVQQWMGILVILGFPVALILSWMYDWREGRIQRVRGAGLPDAVSPRLLRWGLGVVVLASVGAVAGVAWPDPSTPPIRPDAAPSLAILPFEPVNPSDTLAWLTPALEARIEDALSTSPSLSLRSRRAVAAYGPLPLDSLARALDVDYFVQMQVSDVDGLSAVIQLIDARTSTVLESRRVQPTPGSAAIGLVAGLAEAIEQVLRTTLGREVRVREWRADTDNAVAFELRHRAEERWTTAESQLDVNPLLALEQLSAADSLLALSQRHDPDWAEVRLARARMAERTALARIIASRGRDLTGVVAAVDSGIEHATDALELGDGLPAARAVRGRLLYLKARYGAGGEQDRAALVDRAEAELRAALRDDPNLAEGAATLSQILYRERADYEAARWFAQQAYRVDAYLRSGSRIIHRIARSAFEMGDDAAGMSWCREGVRRFPDSPVHHGCVVELMAWGRGPADPDEAWHHFDRIMDTGAPGNPGLRLFYRMAMASVLARAALPDSARAVLADAKAWQEAEPLLDPMVFKELEAAVRFRLGELEAGRRLYVEIDRADPRAGAQAAAGRRLREFLPRDPG